MRMDPFETYTNYLALKLHFEQDRYDYFRYNGKTNASIEAFHRRKDRFKFSRLSNKLTDPEITEYFVANIVRGKKWIGDFTKKNWTEHQKGKSEYSILF